jgi:hypothetical protein
MSAGVRRSVGRVGIWVGRGGDGIKLADNGNACKGFFARKIAFYAR